MTIAINIHSNKYIYHKDTNRIFLETADGTLQERPVTHPVFAAAIAAAQ